MLMSNKIHMTCTYGYISKILPRGFGINLNVDGKTSDFCVANEEFENNKCQKFINSNTLDTLFDRHCWGRTSCNI